MRRFSILAVLTALLLAATVQAKLVKEMQVTRSGKVESAADGGTTVYRLVPGNNKLIVIGDREFFPPATRAALDQAAERKLTVEVTGHLLIFNDQPPVFTLPLHKVEVKGLDMGPQGAAPDTLPVAGSQGGPGGDDTQPFKDARLKSFPQAALGKALDDYAFFSGRSWRVLEPGKAEFRGEIDLASITPQDSRYVDRLLSKDLRDVFKSLTFVARVNLRRDGQLECPDPAVEAVYQDGARERLVWKDPPGYYFDRIFHNRKMKLDFFLSKAAQDPKYGKGMGSLGASPADVSPSGQ